MQEIGMYLMDWAADPHAFETDDGMMFTGTLTRIEAETLIAGAKNARPSDYGMVCGRCGRSGMYEDTVVCKRFPSFMHEEPFDGTCHAWTAKR